MHTPVLLQEVLQYLDPKPKEKYIDATVGAGGHTRAILGRGGRVLGLDRDSEAIKNLSQVFSQELKSGQLTLVQANFAEIGNAAETEGFTGAAGILFDLGLSGDQLDEAKRGFAFQKDGPLDMRFDQNQKLNAHQILNYYPEAELLEIFYKFGEERQFGRKVARAIMEARKLKTLDTTGELFELIKQALPAKFRHRGGDTARRIFMSLRIAVNDELGNIERALPQALDILKIHGRLVGISFHSLEDRIIKTFINLEARGCICPPEFPICICGHKARLKILTKKPVLAGEEETKINSRSRSAKLRAAERIL
jgi:16S rRNA (cytosine1402-N4)-methyltransferase